MTSTFSFANRIDYSDVTPFEIVRVVSDKTVEIRGMIANRDTTWTPEVVPGGFVGHCTNQDEQRWVILSDPTRPTFRIRLGKKGWKDKYGSRYSLSTRPRRFHDYNF
jgi:hypothetical protein